MYKVNLCSITVLAILTFGTNAKAEQIALVGGRLIDGTGTPPLTNSVVIIDNGVIQEVGQESEIMIPSKAHMIDTNGKTVMPGLIDLHVHFRLVGHGDYAQWEKDYTTQRTRDEIFPATTRAALYAGVTSARSLGAEIDSIFWLREQVRKNRIVGPRTFIAGPVLCTPSRVHSSSMSPSDWWIVKGPEDGRAKVRELAKRGVDVIKLWDDDFTVDEFSAMIAETHTNNLKVAAHLLTTDGIRNALKSGLKERDTIHHIGAGPGMRYPDDVVKMIVAQKVHLVATIVAFDGFRQLVEDPEILDDPIWKRSLPEKVYEGVRQSFLDIDPEKSSLYEYSFLQKQDRKAKLRQLYAAGAQFVLGTDSGSRANPHHSAAWREMVLMVDEIGMSNMEVIEAATRIAAEVLGQDSTLGTIEAGKLGDVIVVNGNPLVYMSDMRLVEHVIKNGVIHY